MSDPVEDIARAVLYEGYVLWPYRRGALKNAKRWTFGGVFPPRHTRLHPDDACTMRTQCLLEGPPGVPVDVAVRFLHVVARQPLDASGAPVDALESGGERHVAWEEAVEREVALHSAVARPAQLPIAIPGGRDAEPLPGGGALRREWEALSGSVELSAEPLGDDLHRLTVAIVNTTPWDGGPREAALRRAFVSAHTVLRAPAAAFVSLTDPPERLRAAAASCENVGTWPVLVGDEHTLLSSPIILPDHPRVAPESPGDLFDGGEIDGMLILGLLSLTEQEQRELRASDPRAAQILDRCAGLSPDRLAQLQTGTIRTRGPVEAR